MSIPRVDVPDLTSDLTRTGDQYSAPGSLCDVYKCSYHASGSEPREVAVKALRFRTGVSGDRTTTTLRREIGIWKRLSHDNIVPFFGVAHGFGMSGSVSLVSLWMQNGSLQQFQAMHDDNLGLQHRLQLLLDVANGLNYLHSSSIVHGDINCNNVLLDADYTARLADLGLASVLGSIPEASAYLQGSTIRLGTLHYASPEQIGLQGAPIRTVKSDIYSFGCVLSGKPPWFEVRNDVAVISFLELGRRPGRPGSRSMMNDSHWDFVQTCWLPMGERPVAEAITLTLRHFLSDCPPLRPLRDTLMPRSSQINLVNSKHDPCLYLNILQMPESRPDMPLIRTDFPSLHDLTPYITRITYECLSGGSFGDVYKCCYHNDSVSVEVAVKAFRFSFSVGGKSVMMLRRELGLWKRFSHPNIVPFLGISYGFGMEGAMSLVSLWMQNRSLHQLLAMHDDDLGLQHRLQLLLDVANGLNYLHSLSVVHGDLNPNNVLLDADYTARLVDFGHSSLVGNIPEALMYLQRSTVGSGALRWIAPEQLADETFALTTKIDIYSFGCICLQASLVLSGKPPWSEVRVDVVVILRLARGQMPARPASRRIHESHWNLIQGCWSTVEERPAAEVIISTIQHFLRDCPPSRSLCDTFMQLPDPTSLGSDENDQDRNACLWEHIKQLECDGDAAVRSSDLKEAIRRYSTGLSLNPPNVVGILVKRSGTLAMLGEWENAMRDADEAIRMDPHSPWGYERRHAALHGLQRYDEAVDALTNMLSLIEESPDQDVRQLRKNYVSPTWTETIIDNVIREVFKTSPLVLIDVKNGRLCDGQDCMHTFKSELQFKALVSSIVKVSDNEHIHHVVKEYFKYVTLSHVWRAREPSFQDVALAVSIWELNSSPPNEKLRSFCEVVCADGYRWAWSDTCCIDKTISTVLNQSLMMMYKWYEASAATYVFLVDVDSPSAPGGLAGSIWMTRAWTAQELLAAKVIRFFDRNWKPYLGDTRTNHKESPEIMQELADAICVARETIINFHPDRLTIREKLRLASTRNATKEEDVAYSLIGIFKSDIRPHYGEGDAALGHLLEEIVARSGEVTVLDWNDKSSSYNSCLPTTLAVYSQPPHAPPVIGDAEMDDRVAELRTSLPEEVAVAFSAHVTRLPPARFANRRLHLPSIIFAVKRLSIDFGSGHEFRYMARVSGIGSVEFHTSDKLSPKEPRRLILVHPWIRDLCDPLDVLAWGVMPHDTDDADDIDTEDGSMSPSSIWHPAPSVPMDDYSQALRLVVRLQQPFHAMLLQQQSNGGFKRVATEHTIVVSGVHRSTNLANDISVDVVEIL